MARQVTLVDAAGVIQPAKEAVAGAALGAGFSLIIGADGGIFGATFGTDVVPAAATPALLMRVLLGDAGAALDGLRLCTADSRANAAGDSTSILNVTDATECDTAPAIVKAPPPPPLPVTTDVAFSLRFPAAVVASNGEDAVAHSSLRQVFGELFAVPFTAVSVSLQYVCRDGAVFASPENCAGRSVQIPLVAADIIVAPVDVRKAQSVSSNDVRAALKSTNDLGMSRLIGTATAEDIGVFGSDTPPAPPLGLPPDVPQPVPVTTPPPPPRPPPPVPSPPPPPPIPPAGEPVASSSMSDSDSNSSDSGGGGLSGGAIAGIVIGSVAGAVLLGALAFYVVKRRPHRASTGSHPTAPSSAATSQFASRGGAAASTVAGSSAATPAKVSSRRHKAALGHQAFVDEDV